MKEKLSILKNDKFFAIFILFSAILLLFLFHPYFQKKENNSQIIKEQTKGTYKIGLFTDLHVQRSKSNDYDISRNSRDFFKYFSAEMNDIFHPDVVVEDGDLIEGDGREGQKSIDDFNKVKEYLSKIQAEKIYVAGNHENRGLSKEEWLKLASQSSSYYNFDIEKLRLIVLDGDENKEKNIQEDCYYISEKQIEWLEKTLENSHIFSYKMIFIHFPLLKNQYNPNEKTICREEMAKINNLLQKYKVDAVFSGHAELLRFDELNGVRYFTLPGIEKSKNKKIPWFNCFYEISVGNEIKVKMFYKKELEKEEYNTLIIPSEEFDKIEK